MNSENALACDALDFLHKQIDQNDRLNPKYASVWRQIEAIRRALADVEAARASVAYVALDAIEAFRAFTKDANL